MDQFVVGQKITFGTIVTGTQLQIYKDKVSYLINCGALDKSEGTLEINLKGNKIMGVKHHVRLLDGTEI